jgi:acetate kinase
VIVFTAGIGENDRWIRERIASDMDALGIKIDCELNNTCPRGQAIDLSTADARVHTMVIPTDEEYMIALDTLSLVRA